MTRREGVGAAACALFVLLAARPAHGNAASEALRAKAALHTYNLEHDAALATFREAVAADPQAAGTYRYIVATLSLPLRMVAYAAGFGGGKEKGLKQIEEAAAYSGENQTEARFALLLLYNREKRYDDALKVLAALREQYPRNRLLW